ncbi:DPY30 domain-containing protein 2 isoform X1 [Macaca thibetana thibetana]|uniref:DPY30 domain-containing protein 2 isoform X1 n=2 Tax=Macaca thibetana thibetana TaxID=257877 RepID=UPI0021BC56D6|nr:DPY30 domain-containing protein 2 isoform X1 [Macaca thibetana thibetana]
MREGKRGREKRARSKGRGPGRRGRVGAGRQAERSGHAGAGCAHEGSRKGICGGAQAARMETNYLKRCFGNCLAQALTEVAKVRPSDPIEYLAHWLYHYEKTAKAKEKNREEKIQLQEEYDSSLKEMEMTEMLKQEEYQIQQNCEKCHKELNSETVSTKKTIFMQEDTNPLEKEALKQEFLPGTSSMIPGMPQQVSPSESAG